MKIAIFGDSISEGIGSRKYNYAKELEKIMKTDDNNIEIYNYSYTGTTINYIFSLNEWKNIKFDLIIVAYGNVDGMLRPNLDKFPNFYKYLPKRYKKNGMLNPRPYYSKRWYKSLFQHIDSFIRWNLNRFLLKFQGETTWVSLKEFENKYSKIMCDFSNITNNIILLSTVKVSNKYFPNTNNSYVKYNEIIKRVAEKYNCIYIDLFDQINEDEFYEDLFHPNQKGYIHIANLLLEKIHIKQ